MNLSLEQIEQQLNELRASKNVTPSTNIPKASDITVDSLKELIREVVVQEISLVKDSLTPVVEQNAVIPVQINPNMSLFESIGLGLTPDEQTWLSQPDKLQGVQQHLPIFFQTEDGKLAIQSFIIYYKEQFK